MNIFSLRSILMKWRSSKWSLETLVVTGVKWLQKTNVTAPPLRSLLRVSENRLAPAKAATDSIHTDVLIWSRNNVRSLQLLLLQLHIRTSRQIFCLPSRERKCSGVCVSSCGKCMHRLFKMFFSVYICVNMSHSTLVWQYSTLNVVPWQNALCVLQLVWFCTCSDAGEDEGDLDFSALLKAAKWESWHCFVYRGDSMISSLYFVLLLPYLLRNPLLFLCQEEEETWKSRTRDRCVGTA